MSATLSNVQSFQSDVVRVSADVSGLPARKMNEYSGREYLPDFILVLWRRHDGKDWKVGEVTLSGGALKKNGEPGKTRINERFFGERAAEVEALVQSTKPVNQT